MNAGRRDRHAGVIVPTFSLRSASDWGVGEIPDLAPMAAWLQTAGQGALHTLPLVERADGERSPYSALSAFAIDPIHVALDAVEDFAAAGGRSALSRGDRDAIAHLRDDPHIDYDGVRALKGRALGSAFARFQATEEAGASARARRFAAFRGTERRWLADYVRYRALRERHGVAWPAWPSSDAGMASGNPERERYLAWVQWIAHEQLADARRTASAAGVELVGDLPFTVAVDSADVWARPAEFDPATSIGAPPDAFDAAGQDWALPAFRWDVVRVGDHAWLRERLAHAGRWLDGVRLDHIVGYFRTFLRPPDRAPHFDPIDEPAQRALGAAALDVAQEAARTMRVVVEDLGDIPPFVRDAMAVRDLPGYRVLRWEGDWPAFRDPAAYPACSIATSGTHDTSALATWWSDELDDDGRRRLTEVGAFARLRGEGPAFTPVVHEGLVDGLYSAGSDVALLVVQDVFGAGDRINTPATVGPHNWSYRIPFGVEALAGARGRDLAAWLRSLALRHGRAP